MLESQFSLDSKTCQVKNCLNLDALNEEELVINTLLNANVFPVWDMSCRFKMESKSCRWCHFFF